MTYGLVGRFEESKNAQHGNRRCQGHVGFGSLPGDCEQLP